MEFDTKKDVGNPLVGISQQSRALWTVTDCYNFMLQTAQGHKSARLHEIPPNEEAFYHVSQLVNP
jgi:hypothetical protein